MLILKSFFRRKTTKNYIIIFTSIYFIMFILLLFKGYYIGLNNIANKNSYIYIDNEQDFEILKNFKDMTDGQREEAIQKFAEYAAEQVKTDSNMRASAEYRTLLVKVLTRRTWEAVGGMKNEN